MEAIQPRTFVIAVEAEHYQVFMSIFKGEVNARYEIKEKELIKAMKYLGFQFSRKNNGPGRQFVPTGRAADIYGAKPYVYHIRGQVLEKTKQDEMAKELRELYGWNAQTFVLEVVREE